MMAVACRKSAGTLMAWCGTKNDRIMNSPIAAVRNSGTSRFTSDPHRARGALHHPTPCPRGALHHSTHRARGALHHPTRCARGAFYPVASLRHHPLREPLDPEGLQGAADDDDHDDDDLHEVGALEAADELGLPGQVGA